MSDLPMIRDEALMPTTFDGMLKQADVLVKSGLLPVDVKTAQAAVAIMLTGRELGIPPMQAFRSVYVVKGKPSLSAQLMGALILRAGHSYRVIESTNQACAIEFQRRGDKHIYRHEFSLEDAKIAGLIGSSPTWKAYPKAMLFSRCMSAGARVAMPDVIAGMYTPEEVAAIEGAEVVVDAEGVVVDVTTPSSEVDVENVIRLDKLAEENRRREQPPTPGKPLDWILNDKARAAFWARANSLGLHKDTVHGGFNVESMNGWRGTMDTAKSVLTILDYGCNKTSIGVAGICAALDAWPADYIADGHTEANAIDAIDGYIEEQAGMGATIVRQEELA
jgi:hypothetical protein